MTHTPGPWVIDGYDPHAVCRKDHFFRVATVEGHDYHGTMDGEDIANARLILAAPDMLAALKAALDGFIRGGYITSPVTEQLRAAIAKAEGREP